VVVLPIVGKDWDLEKLDTCYDIDSALAFMALCFSSLLSSLALTSSHAFTSFAVGPCNKLLLTTHNKHAFLYGA
jgi:hypothetical protein